MIDIRLGDCLELFKSIEDNSIDLIVTSPPYNKRGLQGNQLKNSQIWSAGDIQYDSYGDDMKEEEYYKWQVDILNECYRVLKPTGSVFYNHKVRRFDSMAHFPNWVFDSKLKFYQMITWDRMSNANVCDRFLFPNTELIFWLTKDSPKVHKDKAMFKNEVWRISPKADSEHPAPFPIEIPTNCILLTTDVGDTVLDPFSGSGTTGCACKGTNRNYIGFEISQKYVDISKERINNYIDGQSNIFKCDVCTNKAGLW